MFGLLVQAMAVSIGVFTFRGFKGLYHLRAYQPSQVPGVGPSASPEFEAWSDGDSQWITFSIF